MSKRLRIAMISDLHGQYPPMESFHAQKPDLVLIAGDLNKTRKPQELAHLGHRDPAVAPFVVEYQCDYLENEFTQLLEETGLSQDRIFGICGNHDAVGETSDGPEFLRTLPWTYLENEFATIDIEGWPKFTIYGSPYVPTFRDWHFLAQEEQLAYLWNDIKADIWIMHTPPFGTLDRIVPDSQPLGSHALAQAMRIQKPGLIVCGHIHGSGHLMQHRETTLVANACAVDEGYMMRDDPWLFVEMDEKGNFYPLV